MPGYVFDVNLHAVAEVEADNIGRADQIMVELIDAARRELLDDDRVEIAEITLSIEGEGA